MNQNNSTADRVEALIKELIKKGFPDKIIEVTDKFSEIDRLAGKNFHIKTVLQAFRSGEQGLVKALVEGKEEYRKELYEGGIKPYESYLN